MNSALQKQEDGSIKLDVTIPKEEIATTKAAVIEDLVKNAELPGFRKGKAPRKLVEEKLNKDKLNEETLKKLLPKYYIETINEQKIHPIMNPKIHVEKMEDDKDWHFSAVTTESPLVDLDDYKEKIRGITAKSKIVVPGKEQKSVSFDEIVAELLKTVKVKIPKVLSEQEVDRLLSQTLDEIKRLGLTLDQYLASTGKTAADLRADYEKKAETDIKLEFTLQKIAEEEKITVEDKEIEEAVAQAKNEQEKKNLEANKYLLANILRQQKTLDFLRNL